MLGCAGVCVCGGGVWVCVYMYICVCVFVCVREMCVYMSVCAHVHVGTYIFYQEFSHQIKDQRKHYL